MPVRQACWRPAGSPRHLGLTWRHAGQHLELINGYLQYAGGFRERQAWDISARGPGARDPMFIVDAEKA